MNLYEIEKISNKTLFEKAIEKGFKIGYCDTETSPKLVYTYSTFKTFIKHDQIIIPSKLTSSVVMDEVDLKPETFRWDYTGPIIIDKDKVTGGGDDTSVVKETIKRLNKFDLVIMQNGDKFDAPVIQDRACDLGLPPIRNLITLDTLKLSRRSFKRDSHSLDAQSTFFGYGGKIKQDMDDCMAVARGDEIKQDQRVKYNIKDVTDMRKIFWRQINYYNFPQNILNMLRTIIHEEKPYCVKCSARHQKKFDIGVVFVPVKSGGTREKRHQCNRCYYVWRIKK